MKAVGKAIALALLLCGAVSCSAAWPRVGRTTQGEVENKFGPPTVVEKRPRDAVLWRYQFTLGEPTYLYSQGDHVEREFPSDDLTADGKCKEYQFLFGPDRRLLAWSVHECIFPE